MPPLAGRFTKYLRPNAQCRAGCHALPDVPSMSCGRPPSPVPPRTAVCAAAILLRVLFIAATAVSCCQCSFPARTTLRPPAPHLGCCCSLFFCSASCPRPVRHAQHEMWPPGCPPCRRGRQSTPQLYSCRSFSWPQPLFLAAIAIFPARTTPRPPAATLTLLLLLVLLLCELLGACGDLFLPFHGVPLSLARMLFAIHSSDFSPASGFVKVLFTISVTIRVCPR